jgi:hypothetical protein
VRLEGLGWKLGVGARVKSPGASWPRVEGPGWVRNPG